MNASVTPPLVSFAEHDRSPLSIRARALVFIDPTSRALRDWLEALAPLPVPVLIEGETGTGKELLARQLHQGSGRPGLFVPVNCAMLSRKHAEAELFGHAPGASPGAPSSRAGWFGSANGGTLYLDEIADLSLPLQARLLKALETREVIRVGAHNPHPVDVRLVAATSIDLTLAVAAGKFDKRLLDYLGEARLPLPPLRERIADILPLAEYLLGLYCARLDWPVPHIGHEAQALLESHAWPGNTRELENCIHFALLVCDGDEILPRHLKLTPEVTSLSLQRQLKQLLAHPTTAGEWRMTLRNLLDEGTQS
ncbi:sigma 54-interacting transcriptional regulator [Pseudomonas matsuisoli]|uniref:Transcriptional regulator n=1 Tax=Pseudomonas matsuisoli TaxID=1515666 RepID=A0A917PWN3_9PSED|nr:sigma-54-dependent transcriptional regulator [Pseudomonas matsuisoli]GGJ95762.1 transcriptional regulator [Pseudomonas matsuisoli]